MGASSCAGYSRGTVIGIRLVLVDSCRGAHQVLPSVFFASQVLLDRIRTAKRDPSTQRTSGPHCTPGAWWRGEDILLSDEQRVEFILENRLKWVQCTGPWKMLHVLHKQQAPTEYLPEWPLLRRWSCMS